MNAYRITFSERVPGGAIHERRTIVVSERTEAKNGIEAIKSALRSKGISDEDIATGRSVGSIKRLVMAGITFESNKIA